MSCYKKAFILLHLCLACTYLCWLVILPYVKEIVSYKSHISLYESVLSKRQLLTCLSDEDQRVIQEGYSQMGQHRPASFWNQFGQAFWTETPPFALAWLFFSLVIPILFLFSIEGAALSAWILPCIVVGYGGFLFETTPKHSEGIFPKEQYVLENYVNQDGKISRSKRDQLILGWHRYLIQEWAQESPLVDPSLYQEQLDKGFFAFNVARLKRIAEGKGDEVVTAGFSTPPSWLRIGCYFIWNCLFAWIINRKRIRVPLESNHAV